MSVNVRIALFLCDTPAQAVVDADGDYIKIFGEFVRKSIPSDDVTYTIDPYDVRNAMVYPEDIDKYDAIMMTGSGW